MMPPKYSEQPQTIAKLTKYAGTYRSLSPTAWWKEVFIPPAG